MKWSSGREFLGRNLVYGLSLILSFILWLYVLNTKAIEIEKDAAIKYRLPDGKAVAIGPNKHFKVKLKGPQVFLRALGPWVLNAEVDLTRMTPDNNGRYYISQDRPKWNLPFGVEVLESTFEAGEVILGKKVRKLVKIKPVYSKELPPQLKLVRTEMIPSQVAIEGIEKDLSTVVDIPTLPINLGRSQGEGVMTIGLDLGQIKPEVVGDLKAVQFKYLIRPAKANLQLNNIRVRFLSSRAIKSTSTASVSLLVYSEAGEDIRISDGDVRVVADVPEGKVGRIPVELQVNLPPGVVLIKVIPEQVFVYVR